jgi:hypothetical protein
LHVRFTIDDRDSAASLQTAVVGVLALFLSGNGRVWLPFDGVDPNEEREWQTRLCISK